MHLGNYIKEQLKIDVFNRNIIFFIIKWVRVGENTYYYRLKENGQEINNRFLREELFALNDQFN